jgi:N-acetylmuramoyl-L-alanine amidase
MTPFKLARGKVEGLTFQAARHTGKAITPTIIVLHDTASRLTKGNAANYLATNSAKISVHFVVEIDGTITQQIATGNRANHAGESSYHGREDCNNFSIGIEIVNPGRMTAAPGGKARTWFGQLFEREAEGIVEMTTREHGAGLWMPYPEAQIEAVLWLCDGLTSALPSIKDITTHWYVSPGRKSDTNPLFPLASVKSRAMGRDDLVWDEHEKSIQTLTSEVYLKVTAPGDGVNMRTWPSFNPNVIVQIPDGTIVPVLAVGEFADVAWSKVRYGGREGWIVSRYTRPVSS